MNDKTVVGSSKTVDNPWREFIENVISGKNYFRVSEYHELLTDLARLYALEEKHATQTAVVHMGIDDQPHDGRRIDCVKCHSDETCDARDAARYRVVRVSRLTGETIAHYCTECGTPDGHHDWCTLKANERPACANVPALVAHNNAAVDLAHSRLIQINELRSRIDRAIYCLERGWSAAARDALGPVGVVHAEVAASINAAIDSMT